MKKVLSITLLALFLASCTDTFNEENEQLKTTDPTKVCPPGQPDC